VSSVIADLRLDEWDLPLFVHVAGAMLLVGAATAAAAALATSPRAADPAALRRFAYRTILLVGLPAWVVMFAGAEWIYHEEFGGEDSRGWIRVGVVTGEGGLLLLLVSLVCARRAVRTGSARFARVAGALTAIAIAGWLVAVWAMGAKPG
jgi:hypothetical protein